MVKRRGSTELAPAQKRRGAEPREKLAYRLPGRLKQDMAVRVVYDGYGFKGKSRWVSEAITEFLADASWMAQVIDGDMAGGNDESDIINIHPDVMKALTRATKDAETYWHKEINEGARHDPLTAVSVSLAAVVRAAIIWRYYGLKMPVAPSDQPEMDL
jgi:hypothetical protein